MPTPHQRRDQALSPSLEHYLRAIHDLLAEKGYARVTDIAGKIGVAKPAVSAALKTLRSNGLVDHRAYESVLLTEEGVNRAKGVSGKFAVLLQFLTEVLGVEEEHAFVDACLMEHYVSGKTMDRLVDLLRFFEDDRHRDVLTALQAFHRSCESEASCPSCSFHCDVVVQEAEGAPQGEGASQAAK
ncbi:MAG: metal-dependent transcriptional regulator [bacterium]